MRFCFCRTHITGWLFHHVHIIVVIDEPFEAEARVYNI
jgi:hypothetical protein